MVMAEPAVVLFDGAGGAELTGVRDMVTGAFSTPAITIGAGDGPLSLDVDSGTLTDGGRRVRPAVVWTRHRAPGTLVAHARPAGSMSALAASAWGDFLSEVCAAAATTLPGTAPAGTAQVRSAGRLGVRVPRTVLSTDVAAAARQLGTDRVMVKTPDFRLAEPDPRSWATHLPVVLDAPAVKDSGGHPVVVQEYVAHVRELRVYYLHGTVCAFDVGKRNPAATWTDPASVSVTRTDCPGAAAVVVRALAAAWGLRYAAFDLLVTGTGEVVFLEANPDGDWLWYERRARWHGVTFLAAVMLRELFDAAR
ncbi:hypothetical protein [Winogradskya humida]|uniref:ATP-grasp ribosomal peptide maturase n=1 Tax=Winogradskya humida TaxID=113566 RepID=A0ABQ3ZJF2_9ACTN|nr:hypothetical protein [Actinoplanes humidus]GIE18720.1 hypothetical protein Ahu01nite_018220 [Actinoplanes humidus]